MIVREADPDFLGLYSAQSRKLALAPITIGTTWNSSIKSAAGQSEAARQRCARRTGTRDATKPVFPASAMGPSLLLRGQYVLKALTGEGLWAWRPTLVNRHVAADAVSRTRHALSALAPQWNATFDAGRGCPGCHLQQRNNMAGLQIRFETGLPTSG